MGFLQKFFKTKKKKYHFEEPKKKEKKPFNRLVIVKACVFIGTGVLILRLFNLQVLSYSFYSELAAGSHKIYKKLMPKRGNIYLHESNYSKNSPYILEIAGEKLFPIVTNKDYSFVYAVPKLIENPTDAAEKLSPILGISKEDLLKKLDKKDDPYEPIKKKVDDDVVEKIKQLNIRGIDFSSESFRFYPEEKIGGQILGFVGNVNDQPKGLYGLEGYFNDLLKGRQGSLNIETDPVGALIPIGESKIVEAVDGDNIVLTIDRTVQTVACDRLAKWVQQHGADGGSVIIEDPKTGAILSMCSYPDYKPSEYGKAETRLYNNPAIFDAYEPGSIFKPITMAMGLDSGKVTPTSTYEDTGQVVIGPNTIRNSDHKANGTQTMTDVLDKSLNTGVVYVARQVGLENFKKYIKNFGFGSLNGIEMDTEAAGNINSLDMKGDIYMATASFGQGITVTPLQMVNAFAAVANGGKLMQPYIVDEIIRANGTKVKTESKVIRQVISERTSTLLGGMLVTVVREGHGKKAGVPLYYVAGKTGTAQVPRKDGRGYEANATIGSFLGYAPVDNPRFVMLVKIDRPRDVAWAESSAAPLFGDLAKFLLNYYQVPPDEKEETLNNKKK